MDDAFNFSWTPVETEMVGGRRTRRASRKMRGGNEMPMPEASAPSAMAGGKMRAIGSRAEVMHGTAHHTSGGLTRKHLKYNKAGRIVSRKASEAGKKALKRLVKAGYKARKGQFKLFTKKSSRKH
jgi:DVNP family